MPTPRAFSRASLALACIVAPAGAASQLPNPGAWVLGSGQNATATVRGFSAVSLNPAGLGMPGTQGFSIAVPAIRARSGLGPVGLSDLADYEGRLVPDEVKEAWLTEIEAEGRQVGTVGVRVTALALNVGGFGLQLSSVSSGNMDLAPGVAEAILFGNAGRTGEPEDIDLSGSQFDAWAVSSVGASFGREFPVPMGRLALGATAKYHVGHAVAIARGGTGTLTGDPVRVDISFPFITVEDENFNFDNGSGFGVDVGAQFEMGPLALGLSVQNVINTFAWDEDRLVFREGTAFLSPDENETDFDKRPLSEASDTLLDALRDLEFKPVLSVGAAWSLTSDVRIAADIRGRLQEGLDVGPRFHAGAGIEHTGLGPLHLRAGGAVLSDGAQVGGGASLGFGPVRLAGAAMLRRTDGNDQVIGQVTLAFGR